MNHLLDNTLFCLLSRRQAIRALGAGTGALLLGTAVSEHDSLAAEACKPTADMLTPKYPVPPEATGTCWEYVGSDIVIDFVSQDNVATYGLKQTPWDLEFSAGMVHQIHSQTKIKDLTTECDIVVMHTWRPVKPCADAAAHQSREMDKIKKLKLGRATSPAQGVVSNWFQNKEWQELVDLLEAALSPRHRLIRELQEARNQYLQLKQSKGLRNPVTRTAAINYRVASLKAFHEVASNPKKLPRATRVREGASLPGGTPTNR